MCDLDFFFVPLFVFVTLSNDEFVVVESNGVATASCAELAIVDQLEFGAEKQHQAAINASASATIDVVCADKRRID